MNNFISQIKFLDFQKALKTPHLSLKVFMVIIILLTMFNNLEHSASVYLGISYNAAHSDWYNKFQSYMVVIVFDLAVIAFIIKAKNTESIVFAVMLFVINCLFFNVFQSLYSIFYKASSIPSELLKQDQEAVKSLIGEINAVVAKILFAALFSYCIHRFSHLWYDQRKDEVLLQVEVEKKRLVFDLQTENQRVIDELEKELVHEQKRYQNLELDIKGLKMDFERKVQELQQVKEQLKVAELDKIEMMSKLSRKKINGSAIHTTVN